MKSTIIAILFLCILLSISGVAEATTYAGWRSSPYGEQTSRPAMYWINVANTMAAKFPGSTPFGVWLVGEAVDDGTLLYMPCTSTTNINCRGSDIYEPYLSAFDAAGVKVILQVEPRNANVPTLINIVMNRYKKHPSVIGFGIDNEWFGTCTEGCTATAAQVTSWNKALHAINPNYVLMIKHFDELKLPTGIPTDILVVCDDQFNINLPSLVEEHRTLASRFPKNPFVAQIGYPSDKAIWGTMSDPAKTIGTAIQTAVRKPISVIWVDFSITTVFPPSKYGYTSLSAIKNEGFESGKSYWSFYTNGIGTFTVGSNVGQIGTKSAAIRITKSGKNTQLYQTGIVLEPNTRYRVNFMAKSNTGHDLAINLYKHSFPYTDYGLNYVAGITPAWKQYSVAFTTKGFSRTVSDGRIRFWLAPYAKAGDIYYIDGVKISKVV
ncbi:Carbohydrate binding domain protein [uncultured archaeon]|nr:Carbohydrate binding domain protein [uncultured archaeon]